MRLASITDRLAGLGSGKWALHLKARAMVALGDSILVLTIGEPDIRPDSRLLDEATRAMVAGRVGYSNGRGEPSVVNAVVDKYRKRRADVTSRQVMCFPGTQTALFATMLGLVEAGDAVLVGDPLYATYEGVIAATGARMVAVPLHKQHGFRMQAADLERALTPQCRVLLLNTPHNPTGAVLSAQDIDRIGEVCVRHDLWIVCDEVYEQLAFGAPFASPFDDPKLADRTIVVSSISKSHAAPGFRSGWAVGPAEFCDALLPVSETMLFGVQPFIADMTAMALNESFDTSARMSQAYLRRARLAQSVLARCDKLQPLMPAAGMFMLVDVSPTGWSGSEFAWRLLAEKQVAVMPGSSFGEQARDFIRISLTVPDAVLQEAMERIAALANSD